MGKKLLLILFLVTFSSHSQIRERVSFSQAVDKNIKKYIHNSQQAYYQGDIERAQFLFDSLVNHVVRGSYFDNFEVRKKSGRKISFYKFKKPIILITYSSWYTPGIGEIPALNKIAKKYQKDIDFVVLFWDSKTKVRRSSHKYSRAIKVVYVDERDNKNDRIVKIMKHSFGFPTLFFMTADKRLVDVQRTVLHPYKEEYDSSFNLNYNFFLNAVSLLRESEPNKDHLSFQNKTSVTDNIPFQEFQ